SHEDGRLLTEYGYVEQPILGWLCGEPNEKYGDRGLGWKYRDEAAIATYERPLEDPLVEALLVAAILRINPAVKTDAQARLAVGALRRTMPHPDKLTANCQTLDLLRDGARVVLEPGEDATTVHFIAIERHLDVWGRWLSLYPERHGYWNDPEAADPDDPLEASVRGLLRLQPAHLLDFLQHFVVFETKKGTTTKKVARYQQFEAVNELVDRTVSLVGRPAEAQDRTGLIWHTQGSGKSLTMIFAGQKLRRHPALDNPTVLIVVDRRDLKTQLSDDFDACDYPNVEKALGVAGLKRKLGADWRGTLVTTIQAFQGMADLAPL